MRARGCAHVAAVPGLPGNVLHKQGEWAVGEVVAGDSYLHSLIPHKAFMTVGGSSAPSFAAIFPLLQLLRASSHTSPYVSEH